MTISDKDLLQCEIDKLNFSSTVSLVKKVEKQQSHQHCMLCGTQSTFGMKLDFYNDQQGEIWGKAKGTTTSF